MSTSHAAPWTMRRVLAMFTRPTTQRTTPPMSGREAATRHLFGESVRWDAAEMADFDASPILQGGWGAEVDRRVAGGPKVALSDMLILRHWGFTPEQWVALPAIAKMDKREGFYQSMGL